MLAINKYIGYTVYSVETKKKTFTFPFGVDVQSFLVVANTSFIIYFAENVYGKFENREICVDVFDLFKQALSKGEITAKEEQLWQFVVANYGISDFSTKQLEKDFGNAPTQPFALLC